MLRSEQGRDLTVGQMLIAKYSPFEAREMSPLLRMKKQQQLEPTIDSYATPDTRNETPPQ
jgi:hypothetical protein